MALLDITSDEPALGQFLADIAVRLADEGVPVRAICRVLRSDGGAVRRALHHAVSVGNLVELPRDDWPPGSKRSDRTPDQPYIGVTDEDVVTQAMRTFKMTRLQARVLGILLKRKEATKETIHNIIEANRRAKNAEQTDPKMVDVVVCLVRKKLVAHSIEVVTIWGRGYFIPKDHQKKAYDKLFPEEAINNELRTDPVPAVADSEDQRTDSAKAA